MGGLLHFFEFNQGRMAKKVLARKRHHGGLEAPRNSLDLQVQTPQNYCPEGELPYNYQVKEEGRSEKNRYSNVGSMKKLINEELSKQSSTRQNAPSLVARLMGIDTMPLDTKYVVPSDRKISENMGKRSSVKGVNRRGSVSWGSSNFNSSSQMDFDSLYKDIGDDDDGWNQSFGELRPREHPQEEELQKFKKEFEAYQAARFLECSKVAEIGSAPRQLLAQENLNKEKMMHNDSVLHRAAAGKLADLDRHAFKTPPESYGSEYHGKVMELIPAMQRKTIPPRSRTLSRDFEESLMMKSCNKLDTSSSPTRIVILKPGPDSICNHEENLTISSGTIQGRNSIEDFLEEVKERLKCELQGKIVKKGSVVRGNGIETPYNEKPSDPKLIARHIVKQVRESVSRDTGTNLLHSESIGSYKSEMEFNGPSSPEFISRDTRRFLSERLRNVGRSEAHADIPEGKSSSLSLDNHKARLKQVGDANNWEISKEDTAIQTGSFRHELDENIFLHKELSPRNLVRSLSAPVSRSGTSFGKLLLEDRHILTGAQIRRKLEAVETMSVDVKKRKKDRFNIKERVSNFRYNLALRGRLFGRRVQSMVESHGNEFGPFVRDVTSGPTVLMNCGVRHENSTEVPPSPASVCSSVHEDFWRQTEYLSPISTPDVSSRDDNVVPQVFRDISSGLSELRRQLNQLESDGPEDLTMKQEPAESELDQLEDPAESYVRDLLVSSGLYFGSWDKSLLRGDTFAKPIGNSVYEEVEESHKKLVKENDEICIKDQNESKLDHKVLLDLLNEALSVVLGPPLTLSRFRRKLRNSSILPPSGKELLSLVWDVIRVSLYPPSDISTYSLDTLVAQHLGSIPWSGLINDEINILERDIECLITDDLVEELTKDMF
ncbi:hypothetical protein GLYMA_11G086000v4 [Glycine max]|uniref:DUF4378 domain-containing protein n=2 Tax=Glycine subgen. Soja TaxID=1462606 RepID=K7LNP3_SOYBN|nr:uncharacterized protein LOC100779720 [Glycine max]XP_006590753.1 uncharacterized protein LOC100779720 [Glycine max]XP_028190913.1 uncharacterized protein LOC114376818 [Glycine soja]XP_028190914.1 uncharacterized protein LOC114376818 [Glycine soja]KAG4386610.1 hypothetical protein GLYMA_11G086000v4 [Glycine max]KAG4993709.1 hypothetical protein JHK86_030536 [Glycine max]KAG5145120.1 hypothetical protein JHK84_030663 [Glycine max]KAH1158206.1 hypothetical protein GYH30_030445 [Glycine max]|eukprot:XP_006590752.1 uncharacterized protein LOC100779720 [Glycine max]